MTPLTEPRVKLPNLSYMISVGQLRYIQAHCELPAYRNPDTAIGAFLTPAQKLGCRLRGALLRGRLRANPFYPYVLARTRYYDEVFLRAARGAAGCIINIGCGSDTRAYRFADVLKQNGVFMVECDQPEAIHVKEQIARRHWHTEHVQYLPLDLNDEGWGSLSGLLERHAGAPVQILMEGVSPYVERGAFELFLRFLSSRLSINSSIAYDFKVPGVAGDFGRSVRSPSPFRFPADRDQAATWHARLGLRLQTLETSAALTRRLVDNPQAPFEEDCLVQLEPVTHSPG